MANKLDELNNQMSTLKVKMNKLVSESKNQDYIDMYLENQELKRRSYRTYMELLESWSEYYRRVRVETDSGKALWEMWPLFKKITQSRGNSSRADEEILNRIRELKARSKEIQANGDSVRISKPTTVDPLWLEQCHAVRTYLNLEIEIKAVQKEIDSVKEAQSYSPAYESAKNVFK